MFTDELKKNTADDHRDLERHFDFKQVTSDHHTYGKCLLAFHGIVQPLEEELLKFESALNGLSIQLSERAKTHLLEQDLQRLSLKPCPLMRAPFYLSNVNQALGTLYVMEGSTLGGVIISKALRESQILHHQGPHYFHPYGEKTMDMWNQLKIILNRMPEDSREQISSQARITFQHLKKHLYETSRPN